jgi:hypothetical protein
MEKNNKYLESKRIYNSKLSTFQISKELHNKVKEYCKENNIKVKEFLEKLITDKIR